MEYLNNLYKLKKLYLLKSLGFSYINPNTLCTKPNSLELPYNLLELQKQINHCHLCTLSKYRQNIVFGEGNENAKLMFVGEGPGEIEDNKGRPFVGKSGELLTSIITNVLQISREDVYITNIVKCRPPQNREPNTQEALCCMPFLQRQVEIIKPQVIVALGGTALKYLVGDDIKISKVRGTVIRKDGYEIVPTYHPSYLLRNESAKKDAWEDFKIIKKLLGELL